MRKLIVLLMLLDCCSSTVFAQDKKTDSLRQLLSTTKEDTSRVLLMEEIATTFIYSIPDTALFIAQQGLQLSNKIDFKKGQLLCLRATGNVFQSTGNYPRALEAYLQALKMNDCFNQRYV
jgi:two-component system, NtrC family, sensor kinase